MSCQCHTPSCPECCPEVLSYSAENQNLAGVGVFDNQANNVFGFRGIRSTSANITAALNNDLHTIDLTFENSEFKAQKTFANDAARAISVPDFIGQLGVQLDTRTVYESTATTAGAWVFALNTITVNDFGAVGDGVTDDYAAIQEALNYGSGGYRIYVPAGTYMISQELKLPSNTWFEGAGITSTTIKLLNTVTDRAQNVLTNSTNDRTIANPGNVNIVVIGMTLDGNFSRIVGQMNGIPSTGGCCLGFANVTGGLISHVYAKNPCKHGIDIAATTYLNSGPTNYAVGPSLNIRVENCEVSGAGDDSITTHYSGNIEISHCYCRDTLGHYTPGNSNGIEVDDGSYDVTIVGGFSNNCSKGIQIKGHNDGPAATRVKVFGYTSSGCTRNFELRHEDFEVSPDPKSATAYAVELHGCISIEPELREGDTVTPRALQVAAYDGVLINGFTNIGAGSLTPPDDDTEPDTGEDATPALVFVGRGCQNVVVRDIRIYDVSGAEALIQIGGSSRGNVTISGATFGGNEGIPIKANAPQTGVLIENVQADTDVAPEPDCVIRVTSQPSTTDYIIRNVKFSGYADAYITGTVSPTTWENPVTIENGLISYLGAARHILGAGESLSIGSGGNLGLQTYTSLGGITQGRFDASASACRRQVYKSRATTVGGTAILQDGDTIMSDAQIGDDGAADYDSNAGVIATETRSIIDGTPGVGVMPAKYEILTCNAAGTRAVRWNARAAGHWEPGADNVYNVGSASNRCAIIYAGTGAINTSDERSKQQVKTIDPAVLRAWGKVEYLQFKFNDSVVYKGDDQARWHIGVVAQRVKEAFESEGIDPFAYGILCYDAWEEVTAPVLEIRVVETKNEDGKVFLERQEVETSERVVVTEAGNRYGVRYDEAQALEAAYSRSVTNSLALECAYLRSLLTK